jgi:alkylation response protein AidB-like acyl-CoA dehydrogenase
MDISISKEQKDIVREARRFLEKESPLEYVKEMFEDERGFTDDLWKKMAEMEWMALRIPEDYGGLGIDQIDISLVLEEMGRVVLPGPFFSTVMLGAEAIIVAGSNTQKENYLPRIAEGELRGTLALHESDGGADLGYIRMKALEEGSDFILNGTKLFVPDAHVADFLVCVTRTQPNGNTGEGITLFLIDLNTEGVNITLLPSMDGTRKLCSVDFTNARLSPDSILGELHHGWSPLQKILQRAQSGLSAECVGGAHRALEIASNYAKIRVQYDQPIGAYQAIKHRCAQMYVEAESARSMYYWASWAQDYGDEREAAISASVAKSYCSEAFTHNASSGIQVLGGTGFTMENEMHLFLKRAKSNEMALGDPLYHRERLIQILSE